MCLLDLSAAFDTNDHSILLTRFSSWFGIHDSILKWFKSYLSSRSFRVRCNNTFSSLYTSSCGVPQGSVLGPLLSSCTLPNEYTLISSLSLNHHLYADDTSLLFSFSPPSFNSSMTHLQNSLQRISSWMTANLLTLNSYKTEFVAYSFDSKSNLTKYTTPHKIHNSSLNNTHSTPNLGFIFDQHLTFSDQISTTSKVSYYHTRQYTASLHSSLTWFHHSWYHCHLRRSLYTCLL